MIRTHRLFVVLIVLLLVLAACGGDDDDAGDATTTDATTTTTTTTAAPETTTSAAPETTTTAAPETTTTAAAETTTTAASAAPGDATALVTAKTEAAAAAAPAEWSVTPVDADVDAAGSDEIYGECAGPDAFDLTGLEAATIAVASIELEGPQASGSFFPGPMASIEARVFESTSVAGEAFEVLEAVLGTDEGRECLTEQFIDLMGEGMPAEAEFSLSVEEVTAPGADVGSRIILSATAEGITFDFQFDLLAGLDGDCTVYGTFFSFGSGEPFDPALRDTIFGAATSV